MDKVYKKVIKTVIIFIAEIFKTFSFINSRGSCRFTPSCSLYAIEAIEKLSLTKAVFKIIIRLIKCNPFSKGGYDPILK